MRSTAAVLASLAVLAWLPPAARSQAYTATDLGSLAKTNSQAWALNDRGEVCGWTVDTKGLNQAFRWTAKAGMVGLGHPKATTASYGIAINDAGELVGYAGKSFENSLAFVADPKNRLTLLPDLGGLEGWARDVNEQGQVVGESKLPSGALQAALWQGGKVTDLGAVLRAATSNAAAISDTGWIVGKADGAAYALRNGSATILPTLGSRADAYDVNDLGHAVGYSRKAVGVGCRDCDVRAVMWAGGKVVELGVLAPPTAANMASVAYGINNLDQVVGWSTTHPLGSHHAFLWDAANGMQDLNDLVPVGWTITEAYAINDAGQIACVGFQGSFGLLRGVLLTPAKPTPVLINPQPGLAGTSNRIELLGSAPRSLAVFLVGFKPGPLPLPFCGAGLGFQDPWFLAAAVTDAAGEASIDVPVPAEARGVQALFQALDFGACRTTAVSTQTFR